MKILCSADWHLDAPIAAGDAQLRKELLAVPGKIAELCKQENCDMVLLAGDLFDGAYTQQSVSALRSAVTEMAVPVFIAPGNHDHMGIGPWKTEVFPDNVFVFTQPHMMTVAVPQLNAWVCGAGYTSMDCKGLLEGFSASDPEAVTIGILHGDPTVTTSPNCPVTRQQVENSGLDFLALGHIHKGGSFTAGKTLCAWPGCPMGHGYDETGEKGVLIVTIEDTATARFISLDTPRFYDFTIDAGDDAAAAIDKLLPAVGDGNYYRITLTGPSQPLDLNALQSRFSRFPHLKLRDRTTAPLDIWGDAGADSFEGTYFGLLRQALETAEDKETVLLAAKISRQLLEGQEVSLP